MDPVKQLLCQTISNFKNDKGMLLHLFNIMLVYDNARPAYLVETAVDTFNVEKFNRVIRPLCGNLGLRIELDRIAQVEGTPERLLVFKTIPRLPRNDSEMGTALGMYEAGGDYSDCTQPRITLHIKEQITGITVFSEIIVGKKLDRDAKQYLRTKLERWNRTLQEFKMQGCGYPDGRGFHFDSEEVKDDGAKKRLKKIEKLASGKAEKAVKYYNYVVQNKKDYLRDVETTRWPLSTQREYVVALNQIVDAGVSRAREVTGAHQQKFQDLYKQLKRVCR